MTVRIKLSVMIEDKSAFRDGSEHSIDLEAFIDAQNNPVIYLESPLRTELSVAELTELRDCANVIIEEMNK